MVFSAENKVFHFFSCDLNLNF